ncbi:MAG: hypothetical protein ACYC7D_15265 [Nitrososphaerales archaeon]
MKDQEGMSNNSGAVTVADSKEASRPKNKRPAPPRRQLTGDYFFWQYASHLSLLLGH